jgi:hypothetical protein
MIGLVTGFCEHGHEHERPTNVLIVFKVCSLSYLLLHVSASSMPSSGSLRVHTELLVTSESSLIKFHNINKMTLITDLSKCSYKICTTVCAKVKLKHKILCYVLFVGYVFFVRICVLC